MSDQEQLPVCALCGDEPYVSRLWKTMRCESDGCAMKGVEVSDAQWRRLMARPRLAPEHVEALMRTQGKLYCNLSMDLKDAIRAALAALGEE